MAAWGDVPTWLLVVLGAIGGGAALWQLRLQRIQLHDQQEVIRAQTRLQERQQADAVDVAVGAVDGAQAGVLPSDNTEPVHMVAITNGSKRPVREVACKIQVLGTDESVRQESATPTWGEIHIVALGPGTQAETFVPQERSRTMPVLRAGRKAGFAWGFHRRAVPAPHFMGQVH